jgi:hypothetical protein
MSAHTPGPWTIGIGGYLFAQPTPAHLAKFPKNKRINVGHVVTFAECSAEEAQANLRLLAAAPDLLAASADFLQWFETFIGKPTLSDIECSELTALRAAISKATGEPQPSRGSP